MSRLDTTNIIRRRYNILGLSCSSGGIRNHGFQSRWYGVPRNKRFHVLRYFLVQVQQPPAPVPPLSPLPPPPPPERARFLQDINNLFFNLFFVISISAHTTVRVNVSFVRACCHWSLSCDHGLVYKVCIVDNTTATTTITVRQRTPELTTASNTLKRNFPKTSMLNLYQSCTWNCVLDGSSNSVDQRVEWYPICGRLRCGCWQQIGRMCFLQRAIEKGSKSWFKLTAHKLVSIQCLHRVLEADPVVRHTD